MIHLPSYRELRAVLTRRAGAALGEVARAWQSAAAAAPGGQRPDRSLGQRGYSIRRQDFQQLVQAAGLTPEGVVAALNEANAGNMARLASLTEQVEEAHPHLRGLVQSRALSVVGQDWQLVPPRGRAVSRITDACEKMLRGLPGVDGEPGQEVLSFEDATGKLGNSVLRHLAAVEIIWDVSTRQAWPVELAWAPPARFRYNTQWPERGPLGQLRLITDAEPTFGEALDRNKWIIHRPEGRCSFPTRAGLGRVVLKWFMIEWYAVADWAGVVEKFGTPYVYAEYPEGADEAAKSELLEALAALGSDAYSIFKAGVGINFKEIQKSGSADIFLALLNYCDTQMSKAVLGHSAAADSTSGKLGNEDLARSVRQDLREADEAALAATIRRDLLTPFVRLNFGDLAPVPYIEWDVKLKEDREQQAKIVGMAVDFGLHVPAEWAHEQLRIPAPQPGDAILSKPDPVFNPAPRREPDPNAPEPSTPPAPATPPAPVADQSAAAPSSGSAAAQQGTNYRTHAAGSSGRGSLTTHHPHVHGLARLELGAGRRRFRADDDEQAQERAAWLRMLRRHEQQGASLETAAVDQAAPIWARYMRPLRDAFSGATGWDDLQDRLARLELDPGVVQQILEDTQYAAHVLGRAQVAEEAAALAGSIGLRWEPLQAEEALAWLQQRTTVDYAQFQASAAAVKARSFSLARHEGGELVAAVKARLDRAFDEGQSYAEFAKGYRQLMADLGRTATDPWHLQTVFRSATQNALSVGRYKQMIDPDVRSARPYWQYVAVQDDGTTELCEWLDGQTYPADHEFWATYGPPNHFNCRGTIVTLDGDQAEREGVEVQQRVPDDAPRPPDGWDVAPWTDETAAPA